MRSMLFVLEDASMLSRIKILLRDKSITYFYASTGDEAVEIMEQHEIAAAMISLSMPVMDGNELLELFLSKNDRLQFMLLFDEQDTERIISIHNKYHPCKLFCKSLFDIDVLPQSIENALHLYNKEEELEEMEVSYHEKEERFKQTMFEMSAVLNDRMESYEEVIRHFCLCAGYLFDTESEESIADKETVCKFQSQVLEDFVQIHLLREIAQEEFFAAIEEKHNNPEIGKHFKIMNETIAAIPADIYHNIAFLLSVLSFFFNHFYSEYIGKVVISENDRQYILNVLYDVKQNEEMKEVCIDLKQLNEQLIFAYSAKAATGNKDGIIQYKIYFAKPELEIE